MDSDWRFPIIVALTVLAIALVSGALTYLGVIVLHGPPHQFQVGDVRR
jgi:hypothetical protein